MKKLILVLVLLPLFSTSKVKWKEVHAAKKRYLCTLNQYKISNGKYWNERQFERCCPYVKVNYTTRRDVWVDSFLYRRYKLLRHEQKFWVRHK